MADSIIQRLRAWWWQQKFAFHTSTVKLKDKMGRLYVFRDRPDWYVEAAASLLDEAKNEDQDTVRLLQQAAEEWSLRQRRGVKSAWGMGEHE